MLEYVVLEVLKHPFEYQHIAVLFFLNPGNSLKTPDKCTDLANKMDWRRFTLKADILLVPVSPSWMTKIRFHHQTQFRAGSVIVNICLCHVVESQFPLHFKKEILSKDELYLKECTLKNGLKYILKFAWCLRLQRYSEPAALVTNVCVCIL